MIAIKLQFENSMPTLPVSRMIAEVNTMITKGLLQGHCSDMDNEDENQADLADFIHEQTSVSNDAPTYLEAWRQLRCSFSENEIEIDLSEWNMLMNKLTCLMLKSVINDNGKSLVSIEWTMSQFHRTIDMILRHCTGIDLSDAMAFIQYDQQRPYVAHVLNAITGVAKRVIIQMEKNEMKNPNLNQFAIRFSLLFMRTEQVNCSMIALDYSRVDDSTETLVTEHIDNAFTQFQLAITNQEEIAKHEEILNFSPDVWQLMIRKRGRDDIITNEVKYESGKRKRKLSFADENETVDRESSMTPLKKKKKNTNHVHTMCPIKLF